MHVGAHRGEEVPVYRRCAFAQIILVEPDPDNAAYLAQECPDVTVVECAIGPEPGEATLHRAANSVYSGLRADETVPTVGEVVVPVRTLADVQASHPANVLVVDTQGTELEVLASGDLSGVDLIVVETQELSREMYAAFWPDAVEALGKAGFMAAIRWEHEQYFADTLFVRAPTADV
jgi:FkbM family methyltransferase